mgnify:CR=1 FL=1
MPFSVILNKHLSKTALAPLSKYMIDMKIIYVLVATTSNIFLTQYFWSANYKQRKIRKSIKIVIISELRARQFTKI